MSAHRSHYYTAPARVATKILRRLLVAVVIGSIFAMVLA